MKINKVNKAISPQKQAVHDRARATNEKLGLPMGTSWEESPVLDFSKDPRMSLLPDLFRHMCIGYMAFKYSGLEVEDNYVRILDAGCGYGEQYSIITHMRKARGCIIDYIGLDVDPRKKERADKLFPNIDFRLHDLTKDFGLVIGQEKFDVVLSSEVLEHLEKEDGIFYLNQCMEHLVDGGTMILTTPNEHRRDENPWHLYEWDYAELREHIVEQGWTILDEFYLKPNVASVQTEFALQKRNMRMPNEVMRAVLFGDAPGAQSVFVFTK